MVKNPPANTGDVGLISGLRRSPGEGMAAHCSILAWRIPWTEEPGGLQPMGRKELDTTEQLTLSLFFFKPYFGYLHAFQRIAAEKN